MKKLSTVALAILLLTGCMTKEQRFAEYHKSCQIDYGFEVDTDAFKQCILSQELAYQQLMNTVVIIP